MDIVARKWLAAALWGCATIAFLVGAPILIQRLQPAPAAWDAMAEDFEPGETIGEVASLPQPEPEAAWWDDARDDESLGESLSIREEPIMLISEEGDEEGAANDPGAGAAEDPAIVEAERHAAEPTQAEALRGDGSNGDDAWSRSDVLMAINIFVIAVCGLPSAYMSVRKGRQATLESRRRRNRLPPP